MRRYFVFSSKTAVLIITLILVVLLVAVIFPAIPVGGDLLDTKSSYTYDDVVDLMEQYGESGLKVYAIASPTLNTIFPLVYVTFFAGLIYRFKPVKKVWWLAYVPVFAGIWDLCENLQITAMLVQYPDIYKTQVSIASFFTQIKGYLILVCSLLAAAFLLIALIRYFAKGNLRETVR